MANPLHVAVDGSRNGDRGGFAVVYADPDTGLLAHHYGPCGVEFDAELVAVREALRHRPNDEHLVVFTDCSELFLRLDVDAAPKRPSANETLLAEIQSAVAARTATGHRIEFRHVNPASHRPIGHSIAHFLAFAGRITGTPHLGRLADPTEVEDRVGRILAAGALGHDFDEVAHRLVKQHLFPASR